MTLPSLEGVMPTSLASSAFSMMAIALVSKGEMTRVAASGVDTVPRALSGVGVP